MADILVQDVVVNQGSGPPTAFFDELVHNNVIQSTSQACIVDLIAPTFSGIITLINGSKGQLRATWAAGTDATLPVRYEIYVKALTATGLFSAINLIALTDKLQFDVFSLSDGTFVQSGVTYYVGVRAIDGVGNRDSNVASLSVVSTGITGAVTVYEANGAFAVNSSNQFQGTLWGTKNGVLDPTVTLGTATYTVYDKTGTAVAGLFETGIVADVNGQFKIAPVSASGLTESLNHYMVKVGIIMDSLERSDYVPIIQKEPEYDIDGQFHINDIQEFDGSFWVSSNEQVRTTGLGTGSVQVYDESGSLVVGLAQSGITADANGIFKITAFPWTLGTDYYSYTVKVTVSVDSVNRSELIPVYGRTNLYTPKAQFSINALNQFQATLWAVENDKIKTGAALGVANYTVYDAAGTAVAGLTQSSITADVNGRFQITPASAVLLTDLTHYSVKVGIVIDGVERIAYKGFTLLGN